MKTKCIHERLDNLNYCTFCHRYVPRESGYTPDDVEFYTDTIVRIIKNAICKQGSTPNDAIDELNSFFAQAISAERNASLEKIRELEDTINTVNAAYSKSLDKISEIEDLRKTSWLLYQDHKAKNVELGAEIIQLRFDNQNLTSQLERAEKLDGDNATIVRTVEAMIDSDKTHIKQLEGDLVAVRANKEAYEKRCAEYIDRVVKLEKQVKDFVSEINNLGGQLNQANTKISSLRMAFKILEDK